MTTPTATSRRDVADRAALVAIPVLWLPLSLVHPFEISDVTTGGQDVRWLIVHVAMLILTPLTGLLVLVLLRGVTSRTATIARVATICWIAAFAAFESIAGLSTGVLARLGEPQAAERLFDHGVVGGDLSLLGFVAHPLWGVVVIAAAMALKASEAPRTVWGGLAVSSLFVIGHAGPLAFVAFSALAAATWTALTASLSTSTRTARRAASITDGVGRPGR